MSDCNCKDTDRTGLYVMIFVIMVNSCDTNSRLGHLESGKSSESVEEHSKRVLTSFAESINTKEKLDNE